MSTDAKCALAEADQLFPYDIVRGRWPVGRLSPVYAEQMRAYQAGLRVAGERGPTHAPGATTIRTGALAWLLADAKPVVIDTMAYSWGRSIPAAVALQFSGPGGDFTDEAQDRLRSKLHELTGGDLNRPIVAVGFNSERFDGRNLALRLVALGYTRVYWYRGGREAWQVAGLPETELDVQEW